MNQCNFFSSAAHLLSLQGFKDIFLVRKQKHRLTLPRVRCRENVLELSLMTYIISVRCRSGGLFYRRFRLSRVALMCSDAGHSSHWQTQRLRETSLCRLACSREDRLIALRRFICLFIPFNCISISISQLEFSVQTH